MVNSLSCGNVDPKLFMMYTLCNNNRATRNHAIFSMCIIAKIT